MGGRLYRAAVLGETEHVCRLAGEGEPVDVEESHARPFSTSFRPLTDDVVEVDHNRQVQTPPMGGRLYRAAVLGEAEHVCRLAGEAEPVDVEESHARPLALRSIR